MKKILLLCALLTSTVNAEMLTCTNSTLSLRNDDGSYTESASTKINDITIDVEEQAITFYAGGIHELEFWKDYNEYRNNTGKVVRKGNVFSMFTTINDSTGKLVPVKVDYTCK